MAPKVSIVMPVYNGEQYIEETLKSIFQQSYRDYELIIVDDGSIDNTKTILDKYKNKDEVSCYFLENSGSPCKPRNVGIMNSSSKYIAFCDCDDLMMENKLKRSIDFLEKNREVSLVFSNFVMMMNGNIENVSWFEKTQNKEILSQIPCSKYQEDIFVFKRPVYNELIRCNFIGTSTVVLRRDDLMEVGLFGEDLGGIEDRDLWLRLSKANKLFAYINQVLGYYRYLDNSFSRRPKTCLTHIHFWKRLLKSEKDIESIKVIKTTLSNRHFTFGYIMRNNGKYLESAMSYCKCIYYSNIKIKMRVFLSLLMLPFFAVLKMMNRGKH